MSFTNIGPQTLILYKGCGVISKIFVDYSLARINEGKADYDLVLTNLVSGSRLTKADQPDKNYVILRPKDVFKTQAIIPIVFKRRETKLGALSPGSYYLQVVAETWPETLERGLDLRNRWMGSGWLWNDSVKSEPIVIQIAPKPHIRNCK